MTKQNNNNSKTEKNSSLFDNKSFIFSRLFIAIAFTIIGFAAATFTYKVAAERQKNNFIKEIREAKDSKGFIEAIQRNRDLFVSNLDQDLAALENEAKEKFSNHRGNIKKAFGNSASDANAVISSHEDDQNYFYELKFSGFNKDEIVVKVDKLINFSAKTKKEVNDKDKKSSSSSSFDYSFSLPDYDKKVKPEITKEDGKITVKLAKKLSN